MNERIKELAAQAGLDAKEIRDDESLTLYAFEEFDIERFAELVRQDYLRELKALKPVGYMDGKGVLFNDTTHPHLHTRLYALDGEQA